MQHEIEQSVLTKGIQKIFTIKKGVNMRLEQNGEHFQHLLRCLTAINLVIFMKHVSNPLYKWHLIMSKTERRHVFMTYFDPIIIY
mgnify:CR=1